MTSKAPRGKSAAKKTSVKVKVEDSPAKAKHPSRVIVEYDVGFGNTLHIRGTGADLEWNKGIMLKNTKANEWVWETHHLFHKVEFKVLINDHHYEQGENHHLEPGATLRYTPLF